MSPFILVLALILWRSVLPQQVDPTALTAKDQHQNFLVAVDVFSDPLRAKKEFGKADPIKAGLLAVEVYFKNFTDMPIRVDVSAIRLDIDAPSGQHFHLRSLGLQGTADAVAHPKGPSGPSMQRFPSPIPLPHRDSKEQDMENALEPLVLSTDIVPPDKVVHGFVFFDVNHQYDLLPYASLYVPDVKSITSTQGLIYFEVPLKAAGPH